MTWEDVYKEYFSIDEPDIQYYARKIPTIPASILKRHLESVLKVILKCMPPKWIAFKRELLRSEQEWGAQVFTWNAPLIENGDWYCWLSKLLPLPKSHFIGIDWDSLNNDPCRYYLVHMAIETVWIGKRLPDIWEVIDGMPSIDAFSLPWRLEDNYL